MPKWKKDETDFIVSVCRDKDGTAMCRLPKPVADRLDLEKQVRFRILRSRVEVSKP